jgi:ABC-type taurine transport system ATPase subunit
MSGLEDIGVDLIAEFSGEAQERRGAQIALGTDPRLEQLLLFDEHCTHIASRSSGVIFSPEAIGVADV